jgi:hypothetical protein
MDMIYERLLWVELRTELPEIHVQGSSALRREAETGLARLLVAANDPKQN